MTTKTTRFMKFTLAGLAMGLLCFALLITHVLTSDYDGLWYADAAYQSGAWELSLGRFMIPVIDYLRFALNVEPLQSVLTLGMLSAGSALLWELFSGDASGTVTDIKEKGCAMAFLALLCTSPAVCIFLSYRYTAPAYGLSYLLAIAAVWVLKRAGKPAAVQGIKPGKEEVLYTLLAALFLTLCLGTYQAHLGCACAVIVFYAVYLCLQQDTTVGDVLRFLVRSLIAGVLSCAVYKILWDIAVAATKTEVPDYRGAQGLSVFGILRGLPFGIRQAYRFFYDQFFETANRYSLLQGTVLYRVLILAHVLLLVILVLKGARGKDISGQKKKRVLAGILLLLLPAACGVFCLLSNETGFISAQMTMPYMMVSPLIFALAVRFLPFRIPDSRTHRPKWYMPLVILICGITLYGRLCQTQVDQFVMYEGTNTTQRMVQDAVAKAQWDGLLEEDNKLMFIGVPAENSLFGKSVLFDKANGYAQFGQFWRGPYPYWRCYGGLLRRMGVNREVPDLQTYVDLMELAEVKEMPVYPEEGCMLLLEDVVVIKFANELGGE